MKSSILGRKKCGNFLVGSLLAVHSATWTLWITAEERQPGWIWGNLWWGKQRWPLHERESVETTSKLENSSSPTRQSHMFWRLRAMSLVSSAGSKWLRHIQRIGNGIGQNWGTKRTYEIGHLLGPISLHVGGLWFWPMWRPGTKWWTNNNHNQCWSIGSWLSIGYQLVVNWLSIDYWSTITNVGVIDQSTRIKSITNLSHHTLHGYKATLPAGSDATVTRAGP